MGERLQSLNTTGDADRIAVLANVIVFEGVDAAKYIEGAPHLKHESLRRLYGSLVLRLFDGVQNQQTEVRVLDLGAGEGTATLPFLKLGARVTAVDLSRSQLTVLQERASAHRDRLDTRCGDVLEIVGELETTGARFDIVVANSFLHHIPDYVSLTKRVAGLLSVPGTLLTFQDPLRYDTLRRSERLFSTVSYVAWRLQQGDILRGTGRRLRRMRGEYRDVPEDNAEYHIVRAGVDQEALVAGLRDAGLSVEIVSYFSTQSSIGQRLGEALRMRNTFSLIAKQGREAVGPTAEGLIQ